MFSRIFILLSLVLISDAFAQIEVVSERGFFSEAISSTHTLQNFDPGAQADKLIVAVNTQGISGVGFSGNVEEIRFRGRSMSRVLALPGFVVNDPQNAIFSLDNPGQEPGDIVITYIDSTNGCRIAAVSLNRTIPGTSNIETFTAEDSRSVTFNTSEPQSFAIASSVADGDFGDNIITSPNTAVTLVRGDGNGASTGSIAYQLFNTPGNKSFSFNYDNRNPSIVDTAAILIPWDGSFPNVVTTLTDELNTNDNGTQSLREAIRDTASGGTITFDASLAGGTIQLDATLGELLINKSLTIDASALAGGIIIDGGSNGDFVKGANETRCFHITDNNNSRDLDVSLIKLTIRNGVAEGEGGNIRNSEELSLQNCEILGGRSTSSGGGIHSEFANLTLLDCLVSENQAQTDSNLSARGGGIHCEEGNLTLTLCRILDNQTFGDGSDGGGISVLSGDLLMNTSTLSNNQTNGIGTSGGGISLLEGIITMEGSTLSNNRVQGDLGNGGAITIGADTTGRISQFIRCTITGNQASNAQGGAIFNSVGSLSFEHCTIVENVSASGGGAGITTGGASSNTITVAHSVIQGNTGGFDLNLVGSDLTNPFVLIGNNLIGTVSPGLEAIPLNTDPVLLAPLADYGGRTETMIPLLGSPVINAATGSTATQDQRGAPIFDIPDIGAAEQFTSTVTTLTDELDTTATDGDGLSLREAIRDQMFAGLITFDSSLDGATLNLDASLGALIIDKTLEIDASSLTNGITISGGSNGDFILDPDETRCFLIDDSDDASQSSVILRNLVVRNGVHQGSDAGGNIHNRENLTLIDCLIQRGRAIGQNALGGGIFSTLGHLALESCQISSNQTSGVGADGGGLAVSQGQLTLTRCEFSQNLVTGADADGGAIELRESSSNLTNCQFSSNQATDGNGGGINHPSGSSTLVGCSFVENLARNGEGGGLNSRSDVDIINSTFALNTARIGGGIFHFRTGTIKLIQTTVTGNEANFVGGFNFTAANSDEFIDFVQITNSIIAGNVATEAGNQDASNDFLPLGVNFIGESGFSESFREGVDLSFESTDSTVSDLFGMATDTSGKLFPVIANNGGFTQTVTLAAGSPAINAGLNSVIPSDLANDQRGENFPRIIGDTVDLGATEFSRIFLVATASDQDRPNPNPDFLSLREAIKLADNGGLIRFAPALDGQTILLNLALTSDFVLIFQGQGPLAINKAITIDASDLPNGITINGNSNGDSTLDEGETRVLDVNDADSSRALIVTLKNLTLRNGTADEGGNVLNEENLILRNCQIVDGRTVSGTSLGGGLLSRNGKLSLFDCLIANNQTVGTAVGGAGIYSDDADLLLENTEVRVNEAFGTRGGGAGIRFLGRFNNTCELKRSQIVGNRSNATDFDGSGLFTRSGQTLLSETLFEKNSTARHGGGYFKTFGDARIIGCTFLNNEALDGDGGALFLDADADVINSTLVGNTASQGGGIFTSGNSITGSELVLRNCTIVDNEATQAGGGLFNERDASQNSSGPNVQVANSLIAANTAASGEADLSANFESLGVNFIGTPPAAPSGFRNGTDLSFSSTGTNLSQIIATTNASGTLAPFLTSNGGVTPTITTIAGSPLRDAGINSEVSSDTLTDQRNEGFKRIIDGVVDLGAIEFQAPRIVTTLLDEFDTPSSGGSGLSLREALRDSDVVTFAANLNGGIIALDPARGPLLVDRSLQVDASSLADGIMIDGGSNGDLVINPGEIQCMVINDSDQDTLIDVSLQNLTIQNGVLVGTQFNGGGNIQNLENLTLINCRILNGRTISENALAGGIFSAAGSLILRSCEVSGNIGSGTQAFGGGLTAFGSNFTISASTFSNNSVQGGFTAGGGIATDSGTFTIQDSEFSNNLTQNGFGGALAVIAGNGEIARSTFVDNSSPNSSGGGIFNNDQLSVVNSTFIGNSANSGGAIVNSNGDPTGTGFGNIPNLDLLHVTIIDNSSSSEAGGVLNQSGNSQSVTLTNSIVASNTSSTTDSDISPLFTSEGVNFIGTVSGSSAFRSGTDLSFATTGTTLLDLVETSGSNPLLGSNGGLTRTIALIANSPAINAGNNTFTPADLINDQRRNGFARILDGVSDLGAFEFGVNPPFLDPFADEDGDNLSRVLELALGTRPDIADFDNPRRPRISINQNGDATFTFGRGNAFLSGTIFIVERSTTLLSGSFQEIYRFEFDSKTSIPLFGGEIDFEVQSEQFIITDSANLEKAFYRIKAILP